MYRIEVTSKFKKGYKRAVKRGYNIQLLKDVVSMLAEDIPLPATNCDHELSGNHSGFRECHIQPDWLLIYKKEKGLLVLTLSETGTHSDLFNK